MFIALKFLQLDLSIRKELCTLAPKHRQPLSRDWNASQTLETVTYPMKREFLMRIKDLCEKNSLEFEVIDLGTISFLRRLKLKMKGLKAPAIICGEKIVYGVPSEEDLKKLLKS